MPLSWISFWPTRTSAGFDTLVREVTAMAMSLPLMSALVTTLCAPNAEFSTESTISTPAPLPPPHVVGRHLGLLDQNQTLRRAYLSDPDPINSYGLPQSYADMGPAFVLRTQRAAF